MWSGCPSTCNIVALDRRRNSLGASILRRSTRVHFEDMNQIGVFLWKSEICCPWDFPCSLKTKIFGPATKTQLFRIPSTFFGGFTGVVSFWQPWQPSPKLRPKPSKRPRSKHHQLGIGIWLQVMMPRVVVEIAETTMVFHFRWQSLIPGHLAKTSGWKGLARISSGFEPANLEHIWSLLYHKMSLVLVNLALQNYEPWSLMTTGSTPPSVSAWISGNSPFFPTPPNGGHLFLPWSRTCLVVRSPARVELVGRAQPPNEVSMDPLWNHKRPRFLDQRAETINGYRIAGLSFTPVNWGFKPFWYLHLRGREDDAWHKGWPFKAPLCQP